MKIRLKKSLALFLSLLMCLNTGLVFAEGNIEPKLEGQVELEKEEGLVEAKKEETGEASKEDLANEDTEDIREEVENRKDKEKDDLGGEIEETKEGKPTRDEIQLEEDRKTEEQEELGEEKEVEDLDIDELDEPEEESKLEGRGSASEDEHENFDLGWFEYTEIKDEGCIILEKLNEKGKDQKTIEIPGEYKDYKIAIKDREFFQSFIIDSEIDYEIEKLIIKDKVEFKGSSLKAAFFCYYEDSKSYKFCPLKEINLSGLDTSKVKDMSYMFADSNISYLDLSNFDTSSVKDMSYMFSNSKVLELDLSGLDTSKVEDMSGMFNNCGGLEKLDLANFSTSSVTNMENMFAFCVTIKKINLSSFDTSKVENMGSMFERCAYLSELDLSKFNTSRVKNMEYMFNNCSVVKLDLSNFNTSEVTNMNGMFEVAVDLKELDISSFDTSKVINMGNMFRFCDRLEKLDLSNFDTSNVEIMYSMFNGTRSLKNLDLSSFDTAKVKDMGYMFDGCDSLIGLDLSNFNTSNVENMERMFYINEDKELLVIADDEKLLGYDYKEDHRIPREMKFKIIINAGEGKFEGDGNPKSRNLYEFENSINGKDWKVAHKNKDLKFSKEEYDKFFQTNILVANKSNEKLVGFKDIMGEEYSLLGLKNHMFKGEHHINVLDFVGDEEEITYTAIYAEPIISHTVSFIVEGKATRVSVEDGEKIQQRDIPDTSRPGYTFLGWKTREDGSGENFDLASPIKSDLTLYASYRRESSGGDGKPSKPNKEKPDKPEEKPDKPAEKPSEVTPQKPSTPEEQNKVDRYKGGDRSEREDLIGMIIEDQIDYELNKTDHLAYLKGYKDDTVRPEGNLTREEAAMVFYRLMEPEFREEVETEDQDFTDVEAGRWSEKAIATLANAEMITGYKDGSFKPTKEITRAEVSSMIGKLTDTIILPTDFKDIIEHWAEDYINSVEREGWIKGYEDGSFRPNALIKRSEFVTIVNSILERQVKKENILEGIRVFKDLEENKWYYEQVIEATNGHKYVIKDGEEVWTELDKREFE